MYKKLDLEKGSYEFYYNLGLLSTKFSKIESNVLLILGKLILDDYVLTSTILERNSLSQNIELIRKVNKYRRFEEEWMIKLVNKITNVRRLRNLFIHGVWGHPYESENDIEISCLEPKILFDENKSRRQWSHKTRHEFKLSYIKRQLLALDEILQGQTAIIAKLEEFVLR